MNVSKTQSHIISNVYFFLTSTYLYCTTYSILNKMFAGFCPTYVRANGIAMEIAIKNEVKYIPILGFLFSTYANIIPIIVK